MSQGSTRRRYRHVEATGLLIALALLIPAGAGADERIQAGPTIRYTTPNVTMDQGERLTFQNLDIARHDVTARTHDAAHGSLFASPIIGNGEEAFVEGSQFLTTGSYEFFCSLHPEMQGTLNVTSAGTPTPRPTPGTAPPPDTTAPTVRVKIRSASVRRVRRARDLLVEVGVAEAATLALKATARVGGRAATIAKGSLDIPGAGVRRPKLALTRAGRRALSRRSRMAVTVTARAVPRLRGPAGP
jgi:plastocyanin